jgi:uncharacterized protein (DUF2267 family)
MKYDDFLKAVEERTGIVERGEAERTAVTVLEALCDRLTGEEAYDLLAQLPAQLKKSVTITRAAMSMTRDEFVDRIASELQVPREEALDRIRGVFGTLREAVTRGEFEHVLSQLDPEYADLLS